MTPRLRTLARHTATLTALTLCSLLPSRFALADEPPAVTIVISGLRNTQGVFRCSLWNQAKPFPTDHSRAISRVVVKVSGTTATCSFPSVKPGIYAIAGYHDENGNGKLDMGLFGPTEGWFASRDARGTLSPPSFDDAKFKLSGAPLKLSARIVY
jgi:uncharacterized protein (DUF2141 family)